mgnify:CR=1 FL=1
MAAYLTAQAMTALTAVLEQVRPDLVLVQGDTTTAMVAALAVFYQKMPVGHIEAGLLRHTRMIPLYAGGFQEVEPSPAPAPGLANTM